MAAKTVRYVCCGTEGTNDAASSGDLASILQEVSGLRVQLEHCISSNDRLRRTLRKYGAVTDDGYMTSASQRDGKLSCSLFACCEAGQS